MTERPKRDFLFVGCEAGHDWHSLGGCNAGCHEECSCSVPVNFCRRCGDCDYGDNTEAEQVRVNCAALWGDPKTRWAPDAFGEKVPQAFIDAKKERDDGWPDEH